MKKILMLIPALNAGGAERVMVTLANEWSKTNDVTIMVFNDGSCFYEISDTVKIKAMNLMPCSKGAFRYLSIPAIEYKRFKNIFNQIKSNSYDFVLSFCYTTNMMASLASVITKNKNIIVSERNDPYGYSNWIRALINKLYSKNVAVVCQNKMVQSYFKSKKFSNELPILPNPVNFNDIPDRRPYSIEMEIVTVGRLIEQKNHKLLINAFSKILRQYPDYKLKIYGIGPLESDLKKLIDDLNIKDKVELMGTKSKVMYEVNNSEIFVLPSNFEGFPNVLIEAMATGLPVISSNFKTGIAEELINDGENGYLFDVGDENGLIDSLLKILSRKDEFPQMGELNKKVAMGYKDSVIAQKWMDVIEKIVNKGD